VSQDVGIHEAAHMLGMSHRRNESQSVMSYAGLGGSGVQRRGTLVSEEMRILIERYR
jgi:hypothetical protein